MTNHAIRITELMNGMEAEFRERGQSYQTQLYNLKCRQVIVNLHESQGFESLTASLSLSTCITREKD